METLPTAEEIFNEAFNTSNCHIDYDTAGLITIKQAMIKFAKMHVETALKEVEKAKTKEEHSILKSYLLTNIK